MSNLTKEAKIHLATKVDNYEYKKQEGRSAPRFIKNGEFFGGSISVPIGYYNPHDPESPYAMKYLDAIVNRVLSEYGLLQKVRLNMSKYGSVRAMYPEATYFKCTKEFLQAVCEETGFEGKIWEQ